MNCPHFNRVLLTAACLLVGQSVVLGQLDDSFWFVAPEVWAGHGDDPIMLRFSSGEEPAQVSVELPADPTFAPIELGLGANDAMSLDLTPYLNLLENKPANSVLQKGIHITSTSDISCYYEIDNALNADVFVLKGQNALGTEFLLPFQNQLPNHFPQSKSAFDIVATEDNTVITITPSVNLLNHPAGVPFDVILNAGETYGCRSAGVSGPAHPTGTSVTSSAPIAITISDDSIEQTSGSTLCFDLVGDQCTPITEAGTEFVAIRGGLTSNERIYILATQDGTGITQNGTPLLGSLDAGESLSLQVLDPTLHIETTEPVLIFQVTGFGCEVGGGMLPALECTGSGEVVFFRSTNDNFRLNVLTPAGTEGDFLVNGNPNNLQAGDFSVVPASNGEWMFAQIINPSWVITGNATQVTNASGAFHLGLMIGQQGSYGRYGYFSDFAEPEFELTLSNPEDICVGESIQIVPNEVPGATYEWTHDGSVVSTEDTLFLPNVTLENTGMYILNGLNAAGCEIEPDTVLLDIAEGPAPPSPAWDSPICEGDDVAFEANPELGMDSVVWTWPDGTTEVNNNPSLTNLSLADGGLGQVVAYLDGCISAPANFELIITPTFDLELTESSLSACEGSEVTLPEPIAQLPNNADLTWTSAGVETSAGPGDTWEGVTLDDMGWWVLSGEVDGCEAVSDSFEMTVVQPVPLVLGLPSYLCTESDPFEFTTNYLESGYWSASCAVCLDSSSGIFDPAAAGEGTVEITYTGTGTCPASLTTTFEILLTPDLGVVNPNPICVGATAVNLQASVSNGVWSSTGCSGCLDENTFNPSAAGVGTWDLLYETFGDCPTSESTSIEVIPNPSSAFTPITEACLNDLPIQFTPNTPGGQFGGNGVNASGTFMVAAPGDYSVQYVLTGECGSTTEADITIHPLPDASFEVFPVTGCVPYNFEATGTGGQSVSWSFVQPSGVVIPSSELTEATFTLHDAGCGELYRTVTSTVGCVGISESVGICGSPSPASGFSISPEDPSRYEPWVNATSTWSVEDSLLVSWVWQFQESSDIEGTDPNLTLNLLSAPTDPAVICLTVTDSIECATTTCRMIPFVDPIDFFAPSSFTPDHDGVNDAWQAVPTGFEPDEVLQYECLIFNRWGQIVFKSQDLGEHWIGNDQNGDFFTEDGVYSYLILLRLHDGRRLEKTGAIHMFR